jgi:hypothetical protein
MPHPSAYDPDIDDSHEPLDEAWGTLTPEQMQELMSKLRNEIVEARLPKPDGETS